MEKENVMRLEFSPVRMNEALVAQIKGDVLTLNGVALDFGPLPKGALLPQGAVACDWIAGAVMRDAQGVLTVPLILPHGPRAPQETLFPKAIEAGDGPVDLPPFDLPESEEPADDH